VTERARWFNGYIIGFIVKSDSGIIEGKWTEYKGPDIAVSGVAKGFVYITKFENKEKN